MLNNKNPGTILAIMSVVMAIMYWMIFALCCNITKKVGLSNDFNSNFLLYVFTGCLLPIIGISGSWINVFIHNEYDERPIIIMSIGIALLLCSIFLDAKMIIDAFSGSNMRDVISE